MKQLYLTMLFVLVTPLQAAKANTLTLESIIQHAIQNSPEKARILDNFADSEADAFDIETLDNPTAEVDVTAIEDDSSRSVEIEFEQPLRLSNFGSRQSYADALRQTASIEQKAQMLELVHTLTRSYIAYFALQEQEKLISQNVDYVIKKQKLIERAARTGRVDIADAKIFKAEALQLEEQLRTIRVKRANGAVNLLRMAGMDQTSFVAVKPRKINIPELSVLTNLAEKRGSIRSLLESRKTLAEKRYTVAKQDARFPEFAPRAIIDHDLDENNTNVIFGINISIPIWDRNNAELSRARAERNLARVNLAVLDEQNFSTVLATAYEKAQASQLSVSNYQNKILPAWQDVQSVMDRKFNTGQATIFDLMRVRERITTIKRDAFQAYIDSIEAIINLESLTGQSLTKQ